MTSKKLKTTGFCLLLVPGAFLTFFLIGETIGQMAGSFIHLLQLLPILILAFVAWRWPMVAGVLLILIGVVAGIAYVLTAPFPIWTILIVEALLVLFPILSGMCFVLSARKKKK